MVASTALLRVNIRAPPRTARSTKKRERRLSRSRLTVVQNPGPATRRRARGQPTASAPRAAAAERRPRPDRRTGDAESEPAPRAGPWGRLGAG